MNYLVFISAGMGLIVALTIYAVFMPRKLDSLPIGDSEKRKNSFFLRFLTSASYELNSVLPEGVGYSRYDIENQQIKSLLERSANPWGITVAEFKTIRWVMGIIAGIAGTLFGFLISASLPIPWFVLTLILGALGFVYPRLYHAGVADSRDLAFKRQLPEALDLLKISENAGKQLPEGIRDTVPNMRDGILKDEFITIMKNMDSDMQVSQALDLFSERVPNEGVRSFVKAIKEAIELDVPISDALESQSQTSRAEYFSLVKSFVETLVDKALMVLGPTILIALCLIALAPSILSISEAL